MGSVRRSRRRGRRRVRIGAPDPTLTSVAGMLAVTELCDRLDVIGRLSAAIGPLEQRRRGHTAGEVLVGIAAAQLDELMPIVGACSNTKAGRNPRS